MTVVTVSLKDEVWHILSQHKGKDSAISGKSIATRLGFNDDRAIREMILELIEAGSPIAASTGKQKGYFIAETLLEKREYEQSLRNRVIEDCHRLKYFRVASGLHLDRVNQHKML